MKIFILVALMILSAPVKSACVILLHGLIRTENSMATLEKVLLEQGYKVINAGYPSRDYPIEILAEKAIGPALLECEESTSISFVTHSLGGILVRQYLEEHNIPNLHRVVMLAPPNRGSEVVDKLRNVPGYKLLNGQAGLQLGTDGKSIPNALGKADFDLGVIAGDSSINWLLSSIIPGADDGKVSVESTKLEGMNDHITMSATHTFMMSNDDVIAQVIHYLAKGRFNH